MRVAWAVRAGEGCRHRQGRNQALGGVAFYTTPCENRRRRPEAAGGNAMHMIAVRHADLRAAVVLSCLPWLALLVWLASHDSNPPR